MSNAGGVVTAMRLAVSSDFPSTPNDTLLTRLRTKDLRLAWVTGTPGRALRFPLARVAFWRLGIKDLHCVDLTVSADASLSGTYDAMYLTGGNPLVFRESLRRSGFDVRLRDFATGGRFVFGASGGAMQLTANVSPFRLLSEPLESVVSSRADFEALGLAAFELLPHLNRHDAAFLEKVRRYSELVPNDVIALADGAALIRAEDGAWYCSGAGARFSRGLKSDLTGSPVWSP